MGNLKQPRKGKEIVRMFQRKAGAMAHKLAKRRKTRDKARVIREAREES